MKFSRSPLQGNYLLGHFAEESVNLYFAKGTTAKAQGTTATAVGVVGYFKVGVVT